ncbi:MAG: ATP-binding cassette domain-containing protein [Thermoplasmatota archaeon]
MDPILSVQSLRKEYVGGVVALKGISFDVQPGETFGLLGPNGAGKSTLQQILCTLTRPTSGTAFIGGRSVTKDPEGVRTDLGVVFQGTSLDRTLTGRENLLIHGQLYRVPRDKMQERVPELLEMAGLTTRANDLINTYSGGMKRRLELVRGLLHKPKILLLDEPTTGLDPQSRRILWERIAALKKEYGITILLTTHYMEEADNLCDRIAVIDHGEIIALDTPQRLKGKLGVDLLRLRLGAPANGTLDKVRTIANVASVEAEGNIINVRVSAPQSTIPAVVAAFARDGIVVESMEHIPLTMDDVFIDLTGKVRDQKARRTKFRQRWAAKVGGLIR